MTERHPRDSNPPATVFLVDDEPALLKALGRLLKADGYTVSTFGSAEEFLRAKPAMEGGCLVLDVAMPGLDGLALQKHLAGTGATVPIIFLTGQGDIPMSVRAVKAGATDFLTKPVDEADLLRAVRTALEKSRELSASSTEVDTLRQRLDSLTPREREVCTHVIAGKLNKQIAADLGVGVHTVKVHRGRVTKKMGVPSVAGLVRIAQKLGLPPAVS